MVNYTDPHAYRPGGTKSNTIGDWSFRDRVKGIPETLVKPSEKTVLPFQPSNANVSPAITTPSSDSTLASACCSKHWNATDTPTTRW